MGRSDATPPLRSGPSCRSRPSCARTVGVRAGPTMDRQRIDRRVAGGTMARSVDSVAGMDLDEARALALALPEAHEAPHFDLTSFRVGKKVFATAPPDGDELRIFVDESETMACAEEAPG